MLVSDVMSRQVDFVRTTATVKDIAQLIFGRGINGVPVLEGRKIVGFVTERDILDKLYPSVQEYMEDPVNTTDFEKMEKKVREVFSLTAKKIMSKTPITVTADTPLLKAQSLMLMNKIGRLPVVDSDNNLIGIISKGDIFRSVVGDQIPFAGDEEFHDWLSRHYDLVVGWEERLGNEIPDLYRLFKKAGIRRIIDVGCGTGEHDIALAKRGFEVLALENSALMNRTALKKLSKEDERVFKRVEFLRGDYPRILNDRKGEYQAAIFMGNAAAHIEENFDKVLKAASHALSPKNSIMFFQINNFNKIFGMNKRFLALTFERSKSNIDNEFAFLEFYDPPRKGSNNLTLNMGIFEFNGKKWKSRSVNSTPIQNLDLDKITRLLKKLGFKKIKYFGGDLKGSLFDKKFDKDQSYYLNVLARR